MAATINSGPFVSAGAMLGLAGSPGSPDYNPTPGPSLSYQGDGIPDCRYFLQKDQAHRVGVVPAQLNAPYILMCDTTPAASAATPVNIAAAANVASGTGMALTATGSTGITPNLTLIPAGSSGVGPGPNSQATVSVVGIDFGFAMGNCSAATGTIATVVRSNTTANAVSLFTPGQWVAIGRVGNASGTATLFTQVQSVQATGITVAPVPNFSLNSAPIGSCNLYDPNLQVMSPGLLPTSVNPYLAGGLAQFLNPLETCQRGVGISAASGSAGGTFTVRGYTMYGEPVSETITVAAGTGTTYGKKTFKYILSVTPNFTDAHNYSVGTSDTFGFAIRSDFWEYTNLFYNGAFLTAQTGWLAADLTTPATSTTGDSRGTLQVSARGAGSSATATTVSGSIRVALFASVPLYNMIAATPANPAPFYGVTPA
jgi:hypothetical protein